MTEYGQRSRLESERLLKLLEPYRRLHGKKFGLFGHRTTRVTPHWEFLPTALKRAEAGLTASNLQHGTMKDSSALD
jgi:hypothetical protein